MKNVIKIILWCACALPYNVMSVIWVRCSCPDPDSSWMFTLPDKTDLSSIQHIVETYLRDDLGGCAQYCTFEYTQDDDIFMMQVAYDTTNVPQELDCLEKIFEKRIEAFGAIEKELEKLDQDFTEFKEDNDSCAHRRVRFKTIMHSLNKNAHSEYPFVQTQAFKLRRIYWIESVLGNDDSKAAFETLTQDNDFMMTLNETIQELCLLFEDYVHYGKPHLTLPAAPPTPTPTDTVSEPDFKSREVTVLKLEKHSDDKDSGSERTPKLPNQPMRTYINGLHATVLATAALGIAVYAWRIYETNHDSSTSTAY